MKSLYALVALLALCTGFSQAATPYELEAKTFMSRASERYFKLYNKLAEKVYSDGIDDFESAFSTLTTVQKISNELVDLAKEASNFNLSRIHDRDTKCALRNLCKVADLFILGEEYFTSILINLSALKSLADDKDIDPYLNGLLMPKRNSSPLSYYPDIIEIYRKSNNSDELLYYWKTWREKNLLWASLNFFTIIEAFQKAADLMKLPRLEFWFRYYDNKDFIQEMDNVMQELKPRYQELHAFLRHELRKKYGNNVIYANGPIPDHLFQQVLDQTWQNGSVTEAYFPFAELPPYNKLVENFDAKSLIKAADKFYAGLGFDVLNEHFYANQLKEYTEYSTLSNDYKDSGNCRADIFDLTPQVYMLYCEKVDFRKFMQNFGYLARVHYSQEKKNLPSYFFNSFGLEYPVGEAIILSASTPKHLTKIGLTKNFNCTDKILTNRLFRMGINTMLRVPLFFVHAKVLADLLEGVVASRDVNKHYWKLMHDYAGVEPPLNRSEGAMDFPYTFYLDIDQNLQTKKFVSEILGYQFYRAFCKISGQEVPLHNCDFSDNLAKLQSSFRKMMRLGSSKPWREVLATVLDNESGVLSGRALLEYYAPILDWIKAQNVANKQETGWTASKKSNSKFICIFSIDKTKFYFSDRGSITAVSF